MDQSATKFLEICEMDNPTEAAGALKQLLENGEFDVSASVKSRIDDKMKPALVVAFTEYNQLCVGALLLEWGADPNQPDEMGIRPFDQSTIFMDIYEITFCRPKCHQIHEKTHFSCLYLTMLMKYGGEPGSGFENLHSRFHDCGDLRHCRFIHYLRRRCLIDSNLEEKLKHLTEWQDVCEEGQEKFERELSELNGIQISKPMMDIRSMTLYDFLFFKPNKAARYSLNKNIIKIFEDNNGNFEKTYPGYGFALNWQFYKGAKRLELMKSAEEFLIMAIGSWMPNEIIEEILQYSNEDRLKQLAL